MTNTREEQTPYIVPRCADPHREILLVASDVTAAAAERDNIKGTAESAQEKSGMDDCGHNHAEECNLELKSEWRKS